MCVFLGDIFHDVSRPQKNPSILFSFYVSSYIWGPIFGLLLANNAPVKLAILFIINRAYEIEKTLITKKKSILRVKKIDVA